MNINQSCPECGGMVIVHRDPTTDELSYVCVNCGWSAPIEETEPETGREYNLRKEVDERRRMPTMPPWY